MNVRLTIAYDGAEFHGWAEQPSVRTVQGAVRLALAELLAVAPEEVRMQGASRTDAGVHAQGQVVNVWFDAPRTEWDFVRGLNALTPDDLTVWAAEFVHEEFNARHDSCGKCYRYRIWPHRFADPLRRRQAWHVRAALDIDAMRAAASHLVGRHDFTSLRAADCQAQSTERELTRVELVEHEGELVLWVEGTAFLKYMVRNIAGLLVDVGRGHRRAADIPAILAARDRARAGQTAPPHGLTLIQVYYEDR